jgi:hypothetical protein
MPPIVPYRFLVRVAHPCPYVKGMPLGDDDHVVDLPDAARLNNFADLDGAANFADVRLAWNELGLGVQVTVKGNGQGEGATPRRRRRPAAGVGRADPLGRHPGRPDRPPGESDLPPVPPARGRRRAGQGRPGVRPDEDQPGQPGRPAV